MLIHFLKWFQGYLYVKIKGYSPERFINLCSSRKILLWNLRKVEDGYVFFISINGFKQLRPVARKTKTRPIVLRRFGLPFYIHKYKKRKGLLIGIAAFGIILYMLSQYIWNIGVSGQYTHTEEAIIKYLNSIDVSVGTRKGKINCQKIEEQIRKEYVDIGWVSAEIKGTRLLIKITETNMPAPYQQKNKPCHIVATRDGKITSMITRVGTPMVQVGAQVKKGDILVSGIIDIMGDNGILLNKEPVVSDADIVLRTNYEYKNSFSMKYIDKEYNQENFKVYGISMFDKKFFVWNPLKKFNSTDKYDIIMDENYWKLNNSFYLPVKWIKKEFLGYNQVTKKYTKEEAEEKALEQLNRYIEKITEKGVLIIKNNVKITIDDKSCVAKGYLIVDEPELDYRLIKDSEWRIIETDEHSGDDN